MSECSIFFFRRLAFREIEIVSFYTIALNATIINDDESTKFKTITTINTAAVVAAAAEAMTNPIECVCV